MIEPGLYRRVKLEAARSDRQISQIVGDALEAYLRERPGAASGNDLVEES